MAELSARGLPFSAPDRATVDLTDPAAVKNTLGKRSFDTVLHFASRGVKANAHDEALITHEMAMAKSLWPLLKEDGVFLYAGSMSEYGKAGCLLETMACRPQTAYARAKIETGAWLHEQASKTAIRVTVGRIFGAYGPREAPFRLFPSVLQALKTGVPVDLSDCTQIRDFVHVWDVARIFIDLAQASNSPPIMNVGTGEGLILRDVLLRLSEELQTSPELLRFGARQRSHHDMSKLVADMTLCEQTLGHIPAQRLALPGGILKAISQNALD